MVRLAGWTQLGRWAPWTAVILLAGSVQPSRAADDVLAEARRLFTSANYERTLEALARVEEPAVLDAADEYRALCYLALRRDSEAERVIERLVLRSPLQPPDPRRPARFGEVYRSVRHRLVPRLANASYLAAKASLQSKDYDAAIRQFEEALELIRSAEDRPSLADLELVSSEFRILAEQRQRAEGRRVPAAVLSESVVASTPVDPARLPAHEVAAAPVASAPVMAVAATGAAPPPEAPGRVDTEPAPFTPIDRIHDASDHDVVPPVVITQDMPAWNPPWKLIRARSYSGRLAIVVAEDGSVATADIVQTSFAAYDDELLRAVSDWRYEPARKRERPVRYRRIIEFVLKGENEFARR